MINDSNIYESGIKRVLESNDLTQLKNSTILITGANGLIGSSIIDVLNYLNKYYDCSINIVATVRDKQKIPDRFFDYRNLSIIEYDINNKLALNKKIDYIINTASNAHPSKFLIEPVETITTNFIGTKNLLDYTYENKCKRLLYVSSGEIYGQGDESVKSFDENYSGKINPTNPRSCYPLGKLAAENLCASYASQYNVDIVIARPCHIYGPTQTINDSRASAVFIRNILNNQDIIMKSDGSSIRTYTYVSDSVNGIFKVLLSSKDIVYNISDDKEISIKGLAETLVELSDNSKLVMEIDDTLAKGSASFKRGILSNEKIKKELNWYPKYDVKEGFRRTIEYLKDVK